jgi:ABC-type glutathione transport system ATPase component
VIIEHDIPLIMSLSDRVVAMADGEVIACGSPSHVRGHPAVVEAYLGGSVSAIERSGAAPEPARPDPHDDEPPPTSLLVPPQPLPYVPGLGPAKQDALLRAFGTLEALRQATLEDLVRVPGVGRSTARRLQEALR